MKKNKLLLPSILPFGEYDIDLTVLSIFSFKIMCFSNLVSSNLFNNKI